MIENIDYYITNGYKVPLPRKNIESLFFELDEKDEVVLECYEIPINWITIAEVEHQCVTTNLFTVLVLGEEVGFVRVEFPILDAYDWSKYASEVALVKLYRGKRQEES